MQSRDLFSFNISKLARLALIKCHYFTAEDLNGVSADQLSAELSLSIEECKQILFAVKRDPAFSTVTTDKQQLFDSRLTAISTCSKSVDKLLDGGVQYQVITEFYGLPGAGKTQMCLQLSINAQLPFVCNETKGEVVYLDTENSFTSQRIYEIAQAAIETHSHIKISDGNLVRKISITPENLISGIHYTRCPTYRTLLEQIDGLEKFLLNHKQVRLVIIDNITNPIRIKFDSKFHERNAVLQQHVHTLLKLAKKYTLAVVITNQMTTKINNDEVSLVPALGAHWSHCVCNRVCLEYTEETEHWSAKLVKSSYAEVEECLFDIKLRGICDISL
ncbi:DNA repair protein rad51c [Chamberlinius hualienensis]